MPDYPPPPIGFLPDFLPPGAPTFAEQSAPYPTAFPMPSDMSSQLLMAERFDTTLNLNENATETLSSQRGQFATFFDIGCSWQFCMGAGPYPDNMVRAGVDDDGSPIFVGRAFHEGDMIPAKVIPNKQTAYVCYNGEEVAKDQIEVLRSGSFVWEFCRSGEVAEGAVEIGKTSDGEPLYMGRALHCGTQTPGKVQTSHGCLYIPFNGEEVAIQEYEMLCLR